MAKVLLGNIKPVKGRDYMTEEDYKDLSRRYAPHGYGLGDQANAATDVNACKKSGWYSFGSNANGTPFQYGGILIAFDRYETDYVQVAFNVINEEWGGAGAILRRIGTTSGWGEWEYYNPTMEVGKEYRTIERFLGKPVYAKLVSCGGLPATGSKPVTHNSAGVVDWIVSAQGQAMGGITFPSRNVSITTNQTDIVITTTDDTVKDAASYVLLKYTKK